MYLQRDHYKVFFDTSREGMYITTREGYFVDANPSFCQMLGFSRIEILRRHVEDTLALPMERRRFRSEIEANGAVTNFRIKLLDRHKNELSCSISAVVLRDFQGEIDGYIGMVRLIKTQGVVLSPSETEAQKFSLALRGAHDGLWDWDLKRGEVLYSARWKAILGYAPFELTRNVAEWFDRIHPEDLNQLKQAIQACITGGSPALSTYFRMKNKTGDFLWMLVRGLGEFDENGKCVRLAGSLSNITAHIKMLENLKVQEEELTQLNESLTQDKALLARYFSGDVLSRILQDGTSKIRENSGPAAILQIKISKIAGLWRSIGSEVYAEFLNDVLTDLMDLVYGHRGSVNKILGDTLLISFGCPLAEENDLERAVECAREILNYRTTFNDVRPDFLKDPLEFSLGLAWGEVFSGTFGSVHRLEYTLVGAAVQRAARLQTTAEKLGRPLLIDDAVQETCRLRFPFAAANAGIPVDGPLYAKLERIWTLEGIE